MAKKQFDADIDLKGNKLLNAVIDSISIALTKAKIWKGNASNIAEEVVLADEIANDVTVSANTAHKDGDGTDHANVALNDTHRSSDGKDHSDVVANNAHKVSDGKSHSDVVLNNTHRSGNGEDHSTVVSNKAHVSSDGKSHSDVVLNNTHRTSDGKDHSDVISNNAHKISDGKDHSDVVLNNSHRGLSNNPHSTTKAHVGLSNVPNLDTTDAVNKAHDKNKDTILDEGGANEVSALQAKTGYTHSQGDGSDHNDVAVNTTHRTSDGKNHSDVVLNNDYRGVGHIPLSQKGSNSGVAELDGGGKVPVSQLPVSVQGGMKVIGFWNASTNVPNLSSLTLNQGEAYQVSVSGSTNLNGETNWKAKDLAVWDDDLSGNYFKIDNTDDVLSVNTKTGIVILDPDDLDDSLTAHKFTNQGDITKLGGIEALAEVNQTDSEIKTQYEANANTNAFEDLEKSKLGGIESGAEVNIQSDWNQSNSGEDDFIKNKPALTGNDYVATNIPDNTAWLAYIALGLPIKTGDVIRYAGVYYANLTASQSSTTPNADGTNWGFLKIDVDWVDYNTEVGAVPTKGGRVFWSKYDFTNNVDTGLGPILSIGQETYTIIYNGTGSDFANGVPVYGIGIQTDPGGTGRISADLADAKYHTKVQAGVCLTTMVIPNGTFGICTTFGIVRDIDTFTIAGSGIVLYVSPTPTPSGLTTIKPEFPDYPIQIGAITKFSSGAGIFDGQLTIEVKGRTADTVNEAWAGAIRETFDFRTTSNGTVVTGHLENIDDTRDLTLILSDGLSLFDTTPTATIELTAGTDTVPTSNYVYIPKDTKVLTVSLAGFPVTEHCRVATLEVQSAVNVQAVDGVRKNQNHNDHVKKEDDNGHILHVAEWIRRQFATWGDVGCEATLDATAGNGYITIGAGKVSQLHIQDTTELSMPTRDIMVVNDPDTPFRETDNLNTITKFSNGDGWNDKYGKIVVWLIANKTNETSFFCVNIPRKGENDGVKALLDEKGYANYSIPTQYKSNAILVGAFAIEIKDGDVIYDGVGTGYQNLRGSIPSNIAGGGGGGVTTFLGLEDSFSSYTGTAGQLQKTNAGETALEPSGLSEVLTAGKTSFRGSKITGDDLEILANAIDALGLLFDVSASRLEVLAGDICVPNNKGFCSKETGGAVRNLVRLTTANILHIGDAQNRVRLRAGGQNVFDYYSVTGLAILGLLSIDTDISFYGNGKTFFGYDWGNDTLKLDADISIGTSVPDVSAKLDVQSTTKGFLPPRMNTTQRDAITTPAQGLMIRNITTNHYEWYDTTDGWIALMNVPDMAIPLSFYFPTLDADATDLWLHNHGSSYTYHGSKKKVKNIYAVLKTPDGSLVEGTMDVKAGAVTINNATMTLPSAINTESSYPVNTTEADTIIEDGDVINFPYSVGDDEDSEELFILLELEEYLS